MKEGTLSVTLEPTDEKQYIRTIVWASNGESYINIRDLILSLVRLKESATYNQGLALDHVIDGLQKLIIRSEG